MINTLGIVSLKAAQCLKECPVSNGIFCLGTGASFIECTGSGLRRTMPNPYEHEAFEQNLCIFYYSMLQKLL